jgi:Spy/CpxP family protein refolding chaperone
MKNTIKLFVVAIVSAAMAGSVLAQGAGPKGGAPSQGTQKPGQGARGQMGKMQQEIMAKLNLTNDQKAKIKDLGEKRMAEMKKLRESGKQVDRAQMKAMRDKNEADLKAILTAEQYKKYEALMKEMREKMMKERGNRPPNGTAPGGKGSKPPRA